VADDESLVSTGRFAVGLWSAFGNHDKALVLYGLAVLLVGFVSDALVSNKEYTVV
jgi:hypothetical protein